MLSPELHPPTPGDPFLIDTPRAPRRPLSEPDDDTSFTDILNRKAIPAPQPDPTDNAPPAQDSLPERDSGAIDEPNDTEPEIRTNDPDAPVTPDDSSADEEHPADAASIDTNAEPVVAHPASQNAAAPNPVTQGAAPQAGASPSETAAQRSADPAPLASAHPNTRPDAQHPLTAQPANAAHAPSGEQTGTTTAPQSGDALPAEPADARRIAQQTPNPAAPPIAEQTKPADQPNAEQSRSQAATPAHKTDSGAFTQNQSGQQSQNNSGNASSESPSQSVFKAVPASDTPEPTYRAEPAADPRAAPPVLTPQAEPAAAPKLGAQAANQSQDNAQLSSDQVAKFRAGLVRGFNAVLRTSGGSLSMHLTPPTLGKVSIEMTMQEGRVNVQLSAANEQAHRLLNENLAMLRTTLESKGLKVDRLSVQVSTSSAQSQSASPAPNAQQNADSSQQDANHDAGQGQSRGRSDHNNDASSGGDRPDDPTLGIDQTSSDRGGASFAQRLELSLDAVA